MRLPRGNECQCVDCGLFFAGLEGFDFHVSHGHGDPGGDRRFWVTDGARGPVWHFSRSGRRPTIVSALGQDAPGASEPVPVDLDSPEGVAVASRGPAS